MIGLLQIMKGITGTYGLWRSDSYILGDSCGTFALHAKEPAVVNLVGAVMGVFLAWVE